MIELVSVSRDFGDAKVVHALRDVTLRIESGRARRRDGTFGLWKIDASQSDMRTR